MTTTTYLWDTESDNLLSEDDGTSVMTYTNEPTHFGDLVSQKSSLTDNTNFYHFDARGDSKELTSDSETVTDTRLYDAWGNVIRSTGTTEMSFQFVARLGYSFDKSVDRLYVRARWFDTKSIKWFSNDPVGHVEGINHSRYVDNSPILWVDPSGLKGLLRQCVTNYFTREKDQGFGACPPYEVAFHELKTCVENDCQMPIRTNCCKGQCQVDVTLSTTNSGWNVPMTANGLAGAVLMQLPGGPSSSTSKDPNFEEKLKQKQYDQLRWSVALSIEFQCDRCIQPGLFYGMQQDGLPLLEHGGMYELTAKACCWNCGKSVSTENSMQLVAPRGQTGDIRLRMLTGPNDGTRLPTGLKVCPNGRPTKERA
ncbi:MAG: RHS repeat-associated core domain-containing protein [Fuerstiella sp.]